MSIKKKSLLAAAVVLGLGSGVGAMAEGATGSGPNPYVDCGIGAALFPNTHWAAVTSNVIWDIGTTALTSATASPETCQGKKVEAAKFILESYPSVVEQTGRGQGEHLSAMLSMFGCDASAHSAIIMQARSAVARQLESPEYSDLNLRARSAAYYQVINAAVEANPQACSA